MPLCFICGHEKFSSTASQPAASAILARRIHSSSVCPIIEAMTTFVG